MFKKAQGISMNVIVIAVIALLVLVVLSVIFMTNTGVFVRGVIDCTQKGGQCVSINEACPVAYPTEYATWKCLNPDGTVDEEEKCCIIG
jgi:hypothetical protein